MTLKTKIEQLERQSNANEGRHILLGDGCACGPHWMIVGNSPETMQDGEPELRDDDTVIKFVGNVCLRAWP